MSLVRANSGIPYRPILDNTFFRVGQKRAASQGRGEQPSPCPLPGGEGKNYFSFAAETKTPSPATRAAARKPRAMPW